MKFKINLFLFFIIVLKSTTSIAQSSFEKFHDLQNLIDDGFYVHEVINEGYMIAGRTTIPGDSERVFVLKTNLNGDTLWSKVFGESEFTEIHGCAMTADSGLIIACSAGQSNPMDIYLLLIRTNSSGDTVWTRRNHYLSGSSICYTFDGGFVIENEVYNTTTSNSDIRLTKFNLSGDSVWSSLIVSPHHDRSEFVVQAKDSGFAIVGSRIVPGPGGPGQDTIETILAKCDMMGNLEWFKSYRLSQYSEGNCVKQTIDNGFVIGGYNASTFSRDAFILKTNEYGDSTWMNNIGSINFDESAYHISECLDSGYVLTGYAANSSDDDLFVARTNKNGTPLWTKYIDYAIHGNWIAQTSDLGFIVTGTAYEPLSGGYPDIYLLKLNSNGLLLSVPVLKENSKIGVVYPNPASFVFTIELSESVSAGRLLRLDVTGRIVYNHYVDGFRFNIDASQFNPGAYFINLYDDKIHYNESLIIQK